MGEDRWPVASPRDEVLARVAARGQRLRRVRHAVAGLAAVGATGIGVLGLGLLAPSTQPDGSNGGVEQVATIGTDAPGTGSVPGAPGATPGTEPGSRGTTATTPTTSDGSGGPSEGASSSTVPGGSSGSSAGPGSSSTTAPDRGAPTTSPVTVPGDGSPVPGTTTTTTAAPTTSSTTTPPAIDAPRVGSWRNVTDRLVESWPGVCDTNTTLTVSVEITGATGATLSWNLGAGRSEVPMTFNGSTWSAELGPFGRDTVSTGTQVPLVVTATGPGGTDARSWSITLDDCIVP